MEVIIILVLVGLGVLFFVLPFWVAGLSSRVSGLEKELNELKKGRRGVEEGPRAVTRAVLPPVKVAEVPKEVSAKAAVSGVGLKPVVPGPAVPPVLREESGKPVPARVGASFDERVGESFDWSDRLRKMKLLPPEEGSEEVNLVGWWSTRLGLVLGIIAAVFFGMYVNREMQPWVRLLEMVALAGSVFAGGIWLERFLGKKDAGENDGGKRASFGLALATGGLALFYVAAYAAYGLPAMKVTDSAWLAVAWQLAAVGLMAGWAVFRKMESVLSLALGLGYVTSFFSMAQGAEPLPMWSLMVLGLVGVVLLGWKGWGVAWLTSLVGTGVGLMVLSAWRSPFCGGLVPEAVGFWAVLALSVAMLGALFLRREGLRVVGDEAGEEAVLHRWGALGVLGWGLLVGGVMALALDLELSWFYGAFALLAALVGWFWERRFGDSRVRRLMWAKTGVLLSLLFIEVLDGPTRAFALGIQALGLMRLSRGDGWRFFELGGRVLVVVAWLFARVDLMTNGGTVKGALGFEEWMFLGFVIFIFAMVLCHGHWFAGKLKVSNGANGLRVFDQSGLAFRCLALVIVGVELLTVGGFGWDNEWALLLPMAIAGGLLALRGRAAWRDLLSLSEWLVVPLMVLGGMACWLFIWMAEGEMVGPALSWVLAAGALWAWVARVNSSKTEGAHEGIGEAVGEGFVSLAGRSLMVSMVVVFFMGWVMGSDSDEMTRRPILLLALGGVMSWLFGQSKKLAWLADARREDFFWGASTAGVLGLLLLTSWLGGLVEGWVLLATWVMAIGFWWLKRAHREGAAGDQYPGEWLGAVVVGVTSIIGWWNYGGQLDGVWLELGAVVLGLLFIGGWWRWREALLCWIGVLFLGLAGYELVGGWAWADFVMFWILFAVILRLGLFLARLDKDDKEAVWLARPRVASALCGGGGLLLSWVMLSGGGGIGFVWESGLTACWAVAAVTLLLVGFVGRLRGYRLAGLIGIGVALIRLFTIDVQDSLWRIIGFGVTGALLVGIGYLYHRYQKTFSGGDLDGQN